MLRCLQYPLPLHARDENMFCFYHVRGRIDIIDGTNVIRFPRKADIKNYATNILSDFSLSLGFESQFCPLMLPLD